jgi:hypothetical protein
MAKLLFGIITLRMCAGLVLYAYTVPWQRVCCYNIPSELDFVKNMLCGLIYFQQSFWLALGILFFAVVISWRTWNLTKVPSIATCFAFIFLISMPTLSKEYLFYIYCLVGASLSASFFYAESIGLSRLWLRFCIFLTFCFFCLEYEMFMFFDPDSY